MITRQSSIKKAVHHVHTIETNPSADSYGTPKWLYYYYCQFFGIKPKLDVCANHFIHCCDDYFTIDDDMFKHAIKVDFYMNPFYSQVQECMDWAWKQVRDNNVNALICVNAQLGAEWFRKSLWEPYRKDAKNGCYGKRVDLEVVPKRVKFLDRFGNIPVYIDKDGKKHENTAMYWTVFAKLVAGATL